MGYPGELVCSLGKELSRSVCFETASSFDIFQIETVDTAQPYCLMLIFFDNWLILIRLLTLGNFFQQFVFEDGVADMNGIWGFLDGHIAELDFRLSSEMFDFADICLYGRIFQTLFKLLSIIGIESFEEFKLFS